MIRNILKITWRNLLKRKIHSLTNIFGLAIGLACCMVIFLFVGYEQSYDTFHKDSESIYRIYREATFGNQYSAHAAINYSFADLIDENIPAIEGVTRLGRFRGFLATSDYSKEFEERTSLFADDQFLSVFDVEFLRGNRETALKAPNQVLLTRATANRYFGADNPIGETLIMNRGERSFEVVGVIEDWPSTSHIQFDLLVSMSSTEGWYGESMFTHWGNIWTYTYAKINPEMGQEEFDVALNNVAYDFGPEALAQMNVRYLSQAIGDIHLTSKLDSELSANGSIVYVRVFTAIGILILAIACFNFINLSTARASWRAREVGLRKVVGAEKKTLIGQFMGESFFLTLFSLILAFILCIAILPQFNAYSGKDIEVAMLWGGPSIAFMIGLLVVVGFLAGCFPAFLLSSFEPVKVLKGNTNVGNSKLAEALRKSLVVIQFVISIGLVVASLTIYNQLNYADTKPLGYDKEHVVVVDLYNKSTRQNIDPLVQRLKSISGVTHVAMSSETPPTQLNSWWLDGKGENAEMHELMPLMAVNPDFVETMKLEMVEGRDFDERQSDLESGIIFNESAVEFLGLVDPVGQSFSLQEGLKEVRVTGVVKDFHTTSVHEEIGPLMLVVHPSWFDKVLIRVQPGNYDQVLSSIEENWTSIHPDWVMKYHFLDADFDQAYHQEQQLSQLVVTFAILALIIGGLGLFGLANYVADQKTKEIGIRKVMGASLNQVVWLQYQSFITLLVIAFVISIPLVSIVMSNWLDTFAYRINLPWWLFGVGGLFTIVLALGTISIQSIKAGLRNPIDSLRNE